LNWILSFLQCCSWEVEGMGPVKKTARAVGKSLFDKELGKPIGQLIVICGRNKTLSSSLQALEWKIPVKV